MTTKSKYLKLIVALTLIAMGMCMGFRAQETAFTLKIPREQMDAVWWLLHGNPDNITIGKMKEYNAYLPTLEKQIAEQGIFLAKQDSIRMKFVADSLHTDSLKKHNP